MKTYNRSLDHVALALNAGRKGNHTLAAKLFAKAISQPDVVSAIQTLEASNAHAFKLMSAASRVQPSKAKPRGVSASRRLRASEDDVFDELQANDDMNMDDMDMDDMDDAADMGDLEASDMDMDDTDMGDMDDAPAETMASVLRSMTRRRGR